MTAVAAHGVPSLRPGIFGSVPPWLAGTSAGLAQPHDLSDAGQKTIDTTVYPGLKTFANGGRAAQVVVTSLPFTATANNTEYILQSDLVATGMGIVIKGGLASWTVNLNGHTLTFGTATPLVNQVDCFGIGSLSTDRYGISGGQIVNGRIEYGGGPGTNVRDGYGEGYNPVMFHSGGPAYIGGLWLVGAADHATLLSGYYLVNCRIEYNTFDDQSATMINRLAPPCQIRCSSGNTIRWNRVLHARQFGFAIGHGCLVECNEVFLDGLDTNSQCIGGYGVTGATARCNNLYAVGAMPTGLGLGGGSGASNWQVYSNWFEGRYTRQALRTAGDLDDYQNHAVGLSMRWGLHADNRVWRNTLICYATNSAVTGSDGTWDATGKAVFYYNGTATTNNLFVSNVFAAVSLDGVARSLRDPYTPVPALGALTAVAVGPSGAAAGGVTFLGNRIVSDICPLGLPDAYNGELGPNAGDLRLLFDRNSIERIGSVSNFALVSYGGSGGAQCRVDFIDNVYSNVAEGTFWDIDPGNAPGAQIRYRYGYWMTVACTSNGTPVTGAVVTVTDATGFRQDVQITGTAGTCRVRGLTKQHDAVQDTALTPLTIGAARGTLSGTISVAPTGDAAYVVSLLAVPIVGLLPVSNLGTNSVTLNGTVTGAPPIGVRGFWGTTDGGTNPASWLRSSGVGAFGSGATFLLDVTGLVERTSYYYRFTGSNTEGIGWSPPGALFRTLGGTAIVWTNTATSGSWGTAAMWDTYPSLPLFDGTEDVFLGNTNSGGTYALDGDRFVKSLNVQGTKTVYLAAGTPSSSRLILKSGNIARTSTGQYLYISSAAVQIDDGVNPANAVWASGGSGAGLFVWQSGSRICGLPQSTILKTGTIVMALQADNSATFAGTWTLSNSTIQIEHPGGFGAGTVRVQNGGSVSLPSSAGDLALPNALELTGGNAVFSSVRPNTLTLDGPINGPGVLFPGSASPYGAIRLGSASIAATGGVDFNRGCPLVVTGRWTNCGNIVLRSAYGGASLQGNGTIGMAPFKTLTMVQTDAAYANFIAPGDGTPIYAPAGGTVGTLTIGTAGNGNSVTFDRGAQYVVDLAAAVSDRLVVNGRAVLSGAGITNAISLYGTPAPGESYTLMEYSAWNTGRFSRVYLNGSSVPSPTNDQGVNGTHTLVYGPANIRLVAAPRKGMALVVR